jgi:hypothetical protein
MFHPTFVQSGASRLIGAADKEEQRYNERKADHVISYDSPIMTGRSWRLSSVNMELSGFAHDLNRTEFLTWTEGVPLPISHGHGCYQVA